MISLSIYCNVGKEYSIERVLYSSIPRTLISGFTVGPLHPLEQKNCRTFVFGTIWAAGEQEKTLKGEYLYCFHLGHKGQEPAVVYTGTNPLTNGIVSMVHVRKEFNTLIFQMLIGHFI